MVDVGTQLGPYEILALLGAGGMGEVYRARDPRLDRDVAIKVLPEQFARDPGYVARFEREAKAVAALSHPNILALHDYGTDRGFAFAVMELLEGETVRDRVVRSAIAWRKAMELGTAIADGLAAAHAKGIIHRDFETRKPVSHLGRPRKDPRLRPGMGRRQAFPSGGHRHLRPGTDRPRHYYGHCGLHVSGAGSRPDR
jgi:serine/threonine protein kinase